MRIKENIASEFNEFSVNYTNDMIACVPHYLKLLSSFTHQLPDHFSPTKILDLGCGNGNTTAEVLKLFPKAHFELLDASQKMIALCQHRFKGYSIDYTTSYFKDFSFRNEFYDMVTSGFSLHHCESDEKKSLFQSICKSLKSGGIYASSDLMIDRSKPEHKELLKDWQAFVQKNYSDGEKWKWLMEHYNEFDKPDDFNDQIEWLSRAGFSTVEIIFKEDHWVHLRAVK